MEPGVVVDHAGEAPESVRRCAGLRGRIARESGAGHVSSRPSTAPSRLWHRLMSGAGVLSTVTVTTGGAPGGEGGVGWTTAGPLPPR